MRFEYSYNYIYMFKESIASICIIIISMIICLKQLEKDNNYKNYYIGTILSIASSLLMLYPIYNQNHLHIDFRSIPIVIGGFLFGFRVGIISTILPAVIRYIIGGPNYLIGICIGIYLNLFLAVLYRKYIKFKILDKFKTIKNKDILIISSLIIISQNMTLLFLSFSNIAIFNIYHGIICFICLFIIKIMIEKQILSIGYKRELEKKSFEDELTNIKNYRYFKETASNFIQNNNVFSLIFIDVDNFKNFNDKNGHLLGDYALRKLSRILMNEIRANDVVARYGGEEFAILLQNCSKYIALEKAEKIRKSIESTYFKGEENQPFGVLTISCGVSSFPNDGSTLEQLISHADKGLYMAKRYGRNRVECI